MIVCNKCGKSMSAFEEKKYNGLCAKCANIPKSEEKEGMDRNYP